MRAACPGNTGVHTRFFPIRIREEQPVALRLRTAINGYREATRHAGQLYCPANFPLKVPIGGRVNTLIKRLLQTARKINRLTPAASPCLTLSAKIRRLVYLPLPGLVMSISPRPSRRANPSRSTGRCKTLPLATRKTTPRVSTAFRLPSRIRFTVTTASSI